MSLARRRPDYDRIAGLEREIYGKTFDHARPVPEPRLLTSVRLILALRWLWAAASALTVTGAALLAHRDWTIVFMPALPLAMTALMQAFCRKLCGTRGNRPASAYRAVGLSQEPRP